MKLLFVSLFGLLSTAVALADDAKPILVCDKIGRPEMEKIEVFEKNDVQEVVVTDAEGESTEVTVSPAVPIYVEATLPLPKLGEQSRYLQWRHTGWVVYVDEKSSYDRFDVDCQ